MKGNNVVFIRLHQTSHIQSKLIKHAHTYVYYKGEAVYSACVSQQKYRIKASPPFPLFAKGSKESFPCFIYDLDASSCMRTVNSLLQQFCLSAGTQGLMPASSLDSVLQIIVILCLSSGGHNISNIHSILDKNVRLSVMILSLAGGLTDSHVVENV